MKEFNSLNKSPASGRGVFPLMLLIAIVLHGILLVLPIAADSEKSKASKEEQKKNQVPLPPSPLPQSTPQLSENLSASKPNQVAQRTSRQQQLAPQLSTNRTTSTPNRATQQIPLQQDLTSQLFSNRTIPTLDRGYPSTFLQPQATPQLSNNQIASSFTNPTVPQASQQTPFQPASTRSQPITSAVSQWRQESNTQSSSLSNPQNQPTTTTSSQEQKPASSTSPASQEQNQLTTSPASQEPNQPTTSSSSQEPNQPTTSPSSQEQNQPASSTSSQEQNQPATSPASQEQNQPASSTSSQEQKQSNSSAHQKSALTSLETFFRGFPYYLGSWITSGGVLKPKFNDSVYIYHTEDNLKEVATNFERQLQEQGFTITTKTDEDAFRVYQVSRGDKTRFLHLVAHDKKTAIFLDSESHNLDNLKNDRIGNRETALVKFYENFKEKITDNQDLQLQKLKQSDLDSFPQPEALQKVNKETGDLELGKLLDKILLDRLEAITSPSQPISPEKLASTVSSELSKGEEGFKFEQVGTYGGGNLYEVTKGDFKIYMILVSTQNGEVPRTGILLSRNDPRE
jgi:hypothetical protein